MTQQGQQGLQGLQGLQIGVQGQQGSQLVQQTTQLGINGNNIYPNGQRVVINPNLNHNLNPNLNPNFPSLIPQSTSPMNTINNTILNPIRNIHTSTLLPRPSTGTQTSHQFGQGNNFAQNNPSNPSKLLSPSEIQQNLLDSANAQMNQNILLSGLSGNNIQNNYGVNGLGINSVVNSNTFYPSSTTQSSQPPKSAQNSSKNTSSGVNNEQLSDYLQITPPKGQCVSTEISDLPSNPMPTTTNPSSYGNNDDSIHASAMLPEDNVITERSGRSKELRKNTNRSSSSNRFKVNIPQNCQEYNNKVINNHNNHNKVQIIGGNNINLFNSSFHVNNTNISPQQPQQYPLISPQQPPQQPQQQPQQQGGVWKVENGVSQYAANGGTQQAPVGIDLGGPVGTGSIGGAIKTPLILGNNFGLNLSTQNLNKNFLQNNPLQNNQQTIPAPFHLHPLIPIPSNLSGQLIPQQSTSISALLSPQNPTTEFTLTPNSTTFPSPK